MIKINGHEIPFYSFPNGELYFKSKEVLYKAFNILSWSFFDSSDFFRLALVKNYLDSIGTSTALRIQYMPYSRMDRSNETYPFALKTATTLLNGMGFVYIQVVEPHSDVTPALLDNGSAIEWCQQELSSLAHKYSSIFLPDQGAVKRYRTAYSLAFGIKQRDFTTGKITSFTLQGTVGKDVLIVDDCCSAGGTFIHSAKLLKDNGAKKVDLLVNYCEKTVLYGSLFSHINKLYVNKDANPHLPNNHKQIVKI